MPRRTQQLKIFSAQAVITASCGRRMAMTIEQDAKDRETAKRRFAKYRRLWIGDTRWNARVDLRTIRQQKQPGICLAVLSQAANERPSQNREQ